MDDARLFLCVRDAEVVEYPAVAAKSNAVNKLKIVGHVADRLGLSKALA